MQSYLIQCQLLLEDNSSIPMANKIDIYSPKYDESQSEYRRQRVVIEMH